MQLHPVREVSWTCKEAAFSAGLGADCSCTSYQGLCKGEKAQSSLHLDWGRIKPPQTLAIHLLSSATPKVTGCSHRSCELRADHRSGMCSCSPRHPCCWGRALLAYPNIDYGFHLIHTQPHHNTCETLLGLKKMKTHTLIECLQKYGTWTFSNHL